MKSDLFAFISDIDINNNRTWNDKIFITMDMDWAPDFVLENTLKLINEMNCKTTVFVTHQTDLMDEFIKNPNIELGIHPNFNPLLNGENIFGSSIDEVINYYLKIVPDAKASRSHSLTINSRIISSLIANEIKYECSQYVPGLYNRVMEPWIRNNKLICVPHIWEDDLDYIDQIEPVNPFDVIQKNIAVYDFHPIHLYLNSRTSENYNTIKAFAISENEMEKYKNSDTDGIRNVFKNFINKIKNR